MLEENSNNNTDLPEKSALPLNISEEELKNRFDDLTDRGVQALSEMWEKYGFSEKISTKQFKEILDEISDVLAEEKKRLNNGRN